MSFLHDSSLSSCQIEMLLQLDDSYFYVKDLKILQDQNITPE